MNNIQLTPIINHDIIGYDQKEIKEKLSPEQFEHFSNWFGGQTGMIGQNGEYLVYKSDWDRYVNQLPPYC